MIIEYWNILKQTLYRLLCIALHSLVVVCILLYGAILSVLVARHRPRSEWLSCLLHCHRKRSCLHRQELGLYLSNRWPVHAAILCHWAITGQGRVTSSSDPLWSGKSLWRPTDFRFRVDDTPSSLASKTPRLNSMRTKWTPHDHVVHCQQQSVLPKLQALLVSSTRICMPASPWTLSLCGSQSGFLDRDGRFLQRQTSTSLPMPKLSKTSVLWFHVLHFQHALFGAYGVGHS